MSSHLNLESLYRMLASPSAPPALEEREVQLGGFDPHRPGPLVDLSEAPSLLEAERDPSITQTPLQTPDLPPSATTESPSEEEGESYLAFLDQVDERRATRSTAQGQRRRSKGRRERSRAKSRDPQATKNSAHPAQPKAGSQPSVASPAPASSGHGDRPKRRRRRRKPSTGAQGE